ncbi:MAG: TetR family transcriptional regulator [Humidesulfovibrio sp.]|uniref:TetR family transcriptional regulator n=1 Tax=Humidesulfovibrio sp. TaxID=2910988 RepID=UPI0028000061|nr:TetR family transcriptional regulator [Humidesulfovibrio sp.]MDQ7836292.1 TetR family transcriptional regulator [Humidesulfovibrio sp.]
MAIRKNSIDRKTEIVAATLDLVAELGPEGVTTQAVAGRVGITQAGVFRHFPAKRDLWLTVAEWTVTEARRRWSEACRNEESPLASIRRVIEAHLQFIQGTPAIHSLIFSRELHTQNEELRQVFHNMAKDFHAVLTDLSRQAQAAADLPGNIAPQEIAKLLLSLPSGLATQWSLSGRSFDLAEEGRRLLEILLDCLHKAR